MHVTAEHFRGEDESISAMDSRGKPLMKNSVSQSEKSLSTRNPVRTPHVTKPVSLVGIPALAVKSASPQPWKSALSQRKTSAGKPLPLGASLTKAQ